MNDPQVLDVFIESMKEWRVSVDDRLDLILRAQDVTNQHLSTLNGRTARSEGRLDDVETRLSRGEDRFTGIDSRLADYKAEKAFNQGLLALPKVAVKVFQGKAAIVTAVSVVGAVAGYVSGFFSAIGL